MGTKRASDFDRLLAEVRACQLCAEFLPLGPRPVVRASMSCRILIAGQAPGSRVHKTGVPWDDPSGDRLREWLGVDRDTFYDDSLVAIVPIGFCYPGKAERGDMPPRPECAPMWMPRLLAGMPDIELTILAGQYSQAYYLGRRRKKTLAATVQAFEEYLPAHIPLPHPSPRNLMWFRRNPWFESEVLPRLREEFARALARMRRVGSGSQ